MAKCIDCKKEFVPNNYRTDLCKFCRCFVQTNNVSNNNSEVSMTNLLVAIAFDTTSVEKLTTSNNKVEAESMSDLLIAIAYDNNKQEESMTNSNNNTKAFLARLKYQEVLVKEGYTHEECANMDLIEMRDLVDEINPLVIINSSLTVRGGKSKKVTVVKKAA